MPSGVAGLTRYFEESPETLRLRPEHVIVLGISIITLVKVLPLLI
ncbi:MAG: preprotein translocase subunit Sec61beta [Candidatus Aenigmatarchaeota archaeon]